MLTIRLQRVGKAKSPSYRLIVSEKARDTQGIPLEYLGNYNPMNKEKKLEVKADRVKHWLSVGAQTSDTVHNLLVSNKVIDAKKKSVTHLSKKRTTKAAAKAAAAEKKA